MELMVNPVTIPEAITFNYDEIKSELAELMHSYEMTVYTDDSMKKAKADKAALNKLKKALNDERLRREREYMKPFSEFKEKIAELIAIIDKPVSLIDRQLKDYDDARKLAKYKQIEEYFESCCDFPSWLKLEQISNPAWLNATYSMKQIEDDLKSMQETICKELAALAEMPAFGFEATEVYKQTLNLSAAINEGKRLADIQKRKEEAERMRAEAAQKCEAARIAAENERRVAAEAEKVEDFSDARQWIAFKAFLTVEQARELRTFFKERCIEFKAV